MAAPTLFGMSTGTVAVNTGATNYDNTLPADIAAGDIIIVHCFHRLAGSVTWSVPTSGYTESALGITEFGTAHRHTWFWKRAVGDEGGTVVRATRSASETVLGMTRAYVFRGCVASGTPYEDEDNDAGNANPVTTSAKSLGGADRLVVALIANTDDDETLPNLTGSNITFTAETQFSSDVGSDGTLQLCHADAGATTSVDAATYNEATADNWQVRSFALIPVAGDETAPVLTLPLGAGVDEDADAAALGVTTDEADGTLYVAVVEESEAAPSAPQVVAGTDGDDVAAAFADDQVIASTGAKVFTGSGLDDATGYIAYYAHNDSDDNLSAVSTSALFYTAPNDPTMLALVSIEGTISLTWDFTGNDPDYWLLEWDTVNTFDDNPQTTQILFGETEPDDPIVLANATWYFRVFAVKGVTRSAASNTIDFEFLAAPSGFTATADGTDTINLAWTDENTSPNETGFLIEQSADGESGWTEVTTTAADAESYAHESLDPGQTVFYRISAINADGRSEYATADAATDAEGSALTPVVVSGMGFGMGFD